MVYERINNSCVHIAVAEHPPQVNTRTSVPPPTGCPSLPGSPLGSAHAGPAYDSPLSVPPTPASTTYLSTPSDTGASTSTSLETSSAAIPSRRKRRLQRSAPYAHPSASGEGSISGSSSEATDAMALSSIRKGVQQFVMDHPYVIEPCLGEPAAMTIIGSNPGLGTPGNGKSIYSVFFSSSHGRKPRFVCYECGHVDGRVSRALRHQRQEHFSHCPFPCQGGAGHPAW